MHSFGQTFAHSSHPMHLNQSMLCCARYARGSVTFGYGYRWVTGLRPPGTRRLIPGIVTSACLIVARSGRTVPPTVPTLRRPLGSDLGDFIGVLALLHVHELPLARADEAALLRPDPTGALRLDLRAELQEAIDQRLRPYRAAGDEDVRRHERVRALHDGVRVVVRPAADRALAHRDDPFRLRHLFVQRADRGPELEGDRAVQQEDVALARGGPVDDAEPLDVVAGIGGRGHLDRTTHDAEVQRPRGVPLRPVEELPDEASFEAFEDRTARAALHRRIDVLLDPLHEIFGSEADDVRLLRSLNHPITTSVVSPASRSRAARISGSLLTLPSPFRIGKPSGSRRSWRLVENEPPGRLKGSERTSHGHAGFEPAPRGPPRIRREHDARIQNAPRIERLFDPEHDAVDLGSPHPRQCLRANPTDPMFSGRRPAEAIQHGVVEFSPKGLHPLEVGGARRIEERAVVRVAVPDVPVYSGLRPVAAGESRKEFDELRDAVAGDDRIFHQAPRFARTGTLDNRREDGPTHFPER